MEPLTLEWIQTQVKQNRYILSLHADEERRMEGLDLEEVEAVLLNGQILEDYPEDRRGPSCLVYGTSQNRPIHVVCGRNRSEWLVIITVYIPAMPKWATPTKRNTQ